MSRKNRNKFQIKKGIRVCIRDDFKNGTRDRFYPEYSTGTVHGHDRTHVIVLMDDPPGETYKEKNIRIHRSGVLPVWQRPLPATSTPIPAFATM
jgi:hypothetical protein